MSQSNYFNIKNLDLFRKLTLYEKSLLTTTKIYNCKQESKSICTCAIAVSLFDLGLR